MNRSSFAQRMTTNSESQPTVGCTTVAGRSREVDRWINCVIQSSGCSDCIVQWSVFFAFRYTGKLEVKSDQKEGKRLWRCVISGAGVLLLELSLTLVSSPLQMQSLVFKASLIPLTSLKRGLDLSDVSINMEAISVLLPGTR